MKISLFLIFIFSFVFLFFLIFLSILTPFFLGSFLAYLTYPLVDFLVLRLHCTRALGSIFVMVLCYVGFFGAATAVLSWAEQISRHVSSALPMFVDAWWRGLGDVFRWHDSTQHVALRDAVMLLVQYGAQGVGRLGWTLVHNGWTLTHVFFSLLLAPLVSFYLLRDWPLIKRRTYMLIPESYRPWISALGQEIQTAFARYVRGQLLVCMCLMLYFFLSLSFFHVPCAWRLSVMTGLFFVIPYLGFVLSLLVTLGFAWTYGCPGGTTVWILGIYVVGNILEGMILTPWLVGRGAGVHPLWVMFFLLAGGLLKGLTGVLLALPMATLMAAVWRVWRPDLLARLDRLTRSCP